MLDRVWPAETAHEFHLSLNGLDVRSEQNGSIWVVNGDIESALAQAGVPHAIGWGEQASGDSYAVRLGRDKALIAGVQLKGGWKGSYGATDMSGAYATFSLAGGRLDRALSYLTDLRPGIPSPVAAAPIAGYPTVFYMKDGKLFFHVTRPLAYAFSRHLQHALSDLS